MLNVCNFLQSVVHGEYDSVAKMLEKNISLICKKGTVTDPSGRKFENISAFEYTLWALDKHMWIMMLAWITKSEQSQKVLEKMISQYNQIKENGVTYRLNGRTITEKHFDFENTIINELQIQVNSLVAPGDKNWDAIDKQWKEGVGGAQKLLPMHVVYEYCSNEPFYPVPKFTSQTKSSKEFYNWLTGKQESWFGKDFNLASEFALYKGECKGRLACRAGAGCGAGVDGAYVDLKALTTLWEVRTQDFINLKSQLEDQVILESQHQVIPM